MSVGALAIDPSRETVFSASKAPRVASCAASGGRIAQVIEFMRANDIEFAPPDEATALGDDLHRLFANVPFRSDVLGIPGMGEGKYSALRLRQLGTEHQIECPDPDDYFLAAKMLSVRDAQVDTWLTSLEGPIQSFEVRLDSERWHHKFTLGDEGDQWDVSASGLADFTLSVVDKNGGSHLLVLDYKTGRASPELTDEEGRANPQLTTLVGLAQARAEAAGTPYESASVGLITRDAVYRNEPIQYLVFDQEILTQAVEQTAIWADTYDYSRRAGLSDKEEAASALVEDLGENVGAGDHCRYCAGKTACEKLRNTLEERVGVLKDEGPQFLDEVRAFTADVIETGEGNPEEALRLWKKGQEMTKWADLAEVVRNEAAYLVRGIHAKAPDEIKDVRVMNPGVSLKSPEAVQIRNVVETLESLCEGAPNVPAITDQIADPSMVKVKHLVARHTGSAVWQAGNALKDAAVAADETSANPSPLKVYQQRASVLV